MSVKDERREFYAHVDYDGGSWWAYSSVRGASTGYWRGPRFTRLGARWAAWRKTRKLNRLEQRNYLA